MGISTSTLRTIFIIFEDVEDVPLQPDSSENTLKAVWELLVLPDNEVTLRCLAINCEFNYCISNLKSKGFKIAGAAIYKKGVISL